MDTVLKNLTEIFIAVKHVAIEALLVAITLLGAYSFLRWECRRLFGKHNETDDHRDR